MGASVELVVGTVGDVVCVVVEEVVGSVGGVFGAMLVVGNVVDEPGSTREVVVLMTIGGDNVEEVVPGTDVVVVVEGLVDTDGSLLFVVVVVVVGASEEGGEVTKGGTVVVLAKLVVVGLVVVVDTNVEVDEGEVVVVSDGASVVEDVRVVVGQCW